MLTSLSLVQRLPIVCVAVWEAESVSPYRVILPIHIG